MLATHVLRQIALIGQFFRLVLLRWTLGDPCKQFFLANGARLRFLIRILACRAVVLF